MATEQYAFGPFRLDVVERILARAGEPVALPPRAFDLLVALVRRAGRLVRKEELLDELWPDLVVVEANLSQNVWLLRRALGEAEAGPLYVQTVPKAGYRFVAPVARLDAEPAAIPAAAPAARHRATAWLALAAAAGGALLLAFALARWTRPGAPAEAEAARPARRARMALAPLAFANLSGEREAAWLSAALPEMFAAELAAGGHLRLVSGEEVARAERELAPADGGGAPPPAALAANLGAQYLLDGSFVAVGESAARRLRVDVRLLDGRSGEAVVRANATASEAELLELVSEIGARLRRGLRLPPLGGEDASAWAAALPVGLEARRSYFEGLRLRRQLEPLAAQRALERAVAAEPEFALGRLALSIVWTDLGYDLRARQEALAALERAGDLPPEARLWVEAQNHRLAGDWDGAAEALRALLGFYPDQLEYGIRLCEALTLGGRGKEALELVERLRQLAEPGRGDPRLDLAEAQAARGLGDAARALGAAERAVAAGRRAGARFLLARGLTQAGHALDDLGRTAQARAAYEEALALVTALGDRQAEARLLNDLAILAEAAGDVAGAEAAYRRSIAVHEVGGDRRSLSGNLFNLGLLLSERGESAAGQSCYRRALVLKQEIGDRAGKARVLSALAFDLAETGDGESALPLYAEALTIRREVGDQRGVMSTLHNLATLHLYRGEPAKADALLEETAAIAERLGQPHASAAALHMRGNERLARGDLAAARRRQEEALAIWRRTDNARWIAAGTAALADVLLAAGDLESAASTARAAVAQLLSQERAEDAAGAEATLARCLLRQGRFAAARATAEGALARLAGHSQVPARLVAGIAAGEARAAAGDEAGARQLLRAALAEAQRVGFEAWALEALVQLARLDLARGDAEAAARLAGLAREAEARGMGLLAAQARSASGVASAAR
jgi:DNA-binding winged helix-turn-helix (wHTH) protein/tetratricopeptide (TPR) repeat protein